MHAHAFTFAWCHVDVKVQWLIPPFTVWMGAKNSGLQAWCWVPSERDLNGSLNLELWFKPQPLMGMLLNLWSYTCQ